MAMKKKDKLSLYRMDPSGKYVYTGDYVTWQKEDSEYTKNLGKKLGFVAAFFGTQLILGLLDNLGMDGNPFLLLPYTATFLLSAIMIWSLLRTMKYGKKIKAYEYEETILRFPKYVFAGSILCGIAVLCYLGNGIVKGWTNPLYVVLQIIACALCFFMKSSFEKDDAFCCNTLDR